MCKRDTATVADMTTLEKGRHTEITVIGALMSHGWTVLEPVTVEPYDLAIRRRDGGKTYYVQVKTPTFRNEKRYAGEYVVVKGAKNSGQVYSKDEVDYFATVIDGVAYMFDNREIAEYWVKLEDVDKRWTRLL